MTGGALPARALLYLSGVGLLAALLTGATLLRSDGGYDWRVVAFLAVGAAIAQLFVVETTHNQSYHLGIVFVLATALVLPPELVVLTCVVQHVPEWVKERYTWYIQLFNIANYVLGALAAWQAARAIVELEVVGGPAEMVVAGAANAAGTVMKRIPTRNIGRNELIRIRAFKEPPGLFMLFTEFSVLDQEDALGSGLRSFGFEQNGVLARSDPHSVVRFPVPANSDRPGIVSAGNGPENGLGFLIDDLDRDCGRPVFNG